MTARARRYFLPVGALLLLAAAPFGVLQYRIAKSAAFCDAVEALPRGELDQFAERCDRLMRDRGNAQVQYEVIQDTNVLGQFALAGRKPHEIVLEGDSVFIKYIKGNWRYTTVAIWEKG